MCSFKLLCFFLWRLYCPAFDLDGEYLAFNGVKERWKQFSPPCPAGPASSPSSAG